MPYTRFIKILTFALGAATLPHAAQAWEITPHVSAGVALADIDNGGLDYTAVVVRGGIDFNRFLGVEVEGSFGISGRDLSDDANASLRKQFGAFGKIGVPIGDNFNVYTRLGFMSFQREVDFRGNEFRDPRTSTDTASFPSVGFGAQALFGKTLKNGVRFDATSFISSNNTDGGSGFFEDGTYVSLAYVRRF